MSDDTLNLMYDSNFIAVCRNGKADLTQEAPLTMSEIRHQYYRKRLLKEPDYYTRAKRLERKQRRGKLLKEVEA